MTAEFIPENDISERFWEFLERNRTDDEVMASLGALPKDEVVTLFKTCLEARTELAYQLSESGRAGDASEDDLDDLSEGIICAGRASYIDCYYARAPLPPEEEWEEMRGLVHLFARSYHQRYGGNIFDEVDE